MLMSGGFYDTKKKKRKKFTCRRLILDRKQARLDFFIVSEDMFTLVHDSDVRVLK